MLQSNSYECLTNILLAEFASLLDLLQPMCTSSMICSPLDTLYLAMSDVHLVSRCTGTRSPCMHSLADFAVFHEEMFVPANWHRRLLVAYGLDALSIDPSLEVIAKNDCGLRRYKFPE